MTSLLRPQGESEGQDFVYQPFQASWSAVSVYFAAASIFGFMSPEPYWPLFPPGASRFHVIFWVLVIVSPLIMLQMGWSYALTPTEFVVRRFGRERFRLPLHELRDTSTVLAMVWITFATRRVLLVSGLDQDRQLFLQELQLRARRVGGVTTPAVPVQTGEGAVRLSVDALKFPGACVTCGAPPVANVSLEASHWFGIPAIQGLKLEVPVCAEHRRRERLVRWFTWAAILGAGMLLSWAFGVFYVKSEVVFLPGLIIIGTVFGAMLLHVAGLLHVRTWIGWQALGVRTSDLSGDLLHVTVHTRSEPLLRELMKLRQ